MNEAQEIGMMRMNLDEAKKMTNHITKEIFELAYDSVKTANQAIKYRRTLEIIMQYITSYNNAEAIKKIEELLLDVLKEVTNGGC